MRVRNLTKKGSSSDNLNNLFGARKPITKIELYRLVGLKAGTNSEVSARLYIDALIKVLADELMLCGKVNVPNLGMFTAKWTEGKKLPFPDGYKTTLFVPPYIVIRFKPSQKIKDVVNGKIDFEDNEDFKPYWNNLILEGRVHSKKGMDAALEEFMGGVPIETVMSELKSNKPKYKQKARDSWDTRKKSIVPKSDRKYVKGKIVKNNER